MDDSDGAVLVAVDPTTRHSWLGLPFRLSILPMLLVDTALEIAIESSPGDGTVVAFVLPTGVRRQAGAAQWQAGVATGAVSDEGTVR